MKTQDPIPNPIWNQFIDIGQVPDTTLFSLAHKIIKGIPFSPREQAIYSQLASSIERVIQDLKGLEDL